MRFELEADGSVVLPLEHPMATQGAYPAAALIELAAQLAGRRVVAAPGHRGVLVEVRDAKLLTPRVPVGTRLVAVVEPERALGGLQWFRVCLEGVLEVHLTLLVTA